MMSNRPVLFVWCALAGLALLAGSSGCATQRSRRTTGEVPPLPPGIEVAQLAPIAIKEVDASGQARPLYRGAMAPATATTGLSTGSPVVRVSMPDGSPAVCGDFSVSLWFRCDRLPALASGYAALAAKCEPGTTNREWLLGLDTSGRVFIESSGGGATPRLTGSALYPTGVWRHAAAVWSTTGVARLHVNGAVVASGTLVRVGATATPVTLADTHPGLGEHALVGAVDEVKLWRTGLTPAAVTAQYGAAPDRDGDGVMDGNDPDDNNDGVPDAWAWQYFGDRLGGTPGADADQDGMSNWDEYVAGSDPSDRWSRFMAGPVKSTGTSTPLVVECEGVAGRRYQLWQRPTLEGAGTWTALGAPVSCSQSGPVQIPVPAAATTNRSFFCVSVSL